MRLDLRLSHRLAIVFTLFGAAIAGGFQYTHIRELRALTYARQRTLADATSAAVKALVESQFRGGSPGRLGRNLEPMVRQTDVASIAVYDARRKRLVARYDDSKLLARVPHPGVPIDQVTDGIYDVERPVDLGGRDGWLEIGFRTGSLEARLRELGSSAVRFGVMALLAIGLLAWMIGAWFGLQLARLVPRIETLTRDPLSFRPLRGEGDDEVGRLVAAFNRLGASLKAETLRRRELEREKQDLAAMLVHDLKTPLTVIRAGVTLLKEQMSEKSAPKRGRGAAQPGTQDRTIQLLELSSQRLQRMIEDVLQLARLEEVTGLRERAPLDIPAMIRACAKDFELITSERRQKLSLKLPREPLPRTSGDATLLRRVLDNLVNNAVEHAPSGGQITIGAAADEAGRVRLTVSDSGPGVPPEARADLFRKFFQKDIKRHVGNVGLGLAFCEKVVSRHDGLIGVEDAVPRGACFFVVLPADQPHLL